MTVINTPHLALGLKRGVDDVQDEFEVFLKEATENATKVTSSKADAIGVIANETKKKKGRLQA